MVFCGGQSSFVSLLKMHDDYDDCLKYDISGCVANINPSVPIYLLCAWR